MDKLKSYKAKRNFSRTPEPDAKKKAAKDNPPIFVIQKHDASRLHFDLRLQIDGVMKSWAVPKGPSLNPAFKRLAVETEDHPMEYADFEGTIPQGQYGGGTVMIWDKGFYASVKDEPMEESYRKGRVEIILEGKKIKGAFALVRTAKDWLLIKMKDKEVRANTEIGTKDRSVKTDRTMEEIANARSSG